MADHLPPSLRVAVTGATGFLGRALVDALVARGHDVVALSRTPRATTEPRRHWAAYDPASPESIRAAVEGTDAVVHLAGENLAEGRWTKAKLSRIRSSRVDGTRALVDGIRLAERRPRVLVAGSAIGFYGPRPWDEECTEQTPAGSDYLAGVCVEWEAESRRAEAAGLRVALARTGIVLGPGGGALAQMRTPFLWFVGGPVGDGRQPMSWIHRDDLTSMLVAAVEDARWTGPFNGVAPSPVSNREFAKALGKALHRPSFLRAPTWALRIALGRVAEVVTTGQRVTPATALSHGFAFRFPTLEKALTDLVGAPEPAKA